MIRKLSALLAAIMLLTSVYVPGVYADSGNAGTGYYYWSFEEGAQAGVTGANPWHGGVLGPWQGYYNDALSATAAPEGTGLQGMKALKIDKTRSNGGNGISTVEQSILQMASAPGNIISAWVYVDPTYLGDSIIMHDLNLRDWAVSGTSAGEIYAVRASASSQIAPGWNNIRYQVPAAKTDMWTKGRLTLNIRTLFNIAGVKALYPNMTEEEATAYYTQLNDNLNLEWYVDSIYIGPPAYEPDAGMLPAGFASDGLNAGPAEDTSPPVLSQGTGTRLDASNGAVSFTSDKAGTAYYGVGSAPADTTGTGTTVVAGANTLVVPLSGNDAKDIYVVVKDLLGRVSSSSFKVAVPAYADDENPTGGERIPYYYWSFEEGASSGSSGISPWQGEALTPWQGYWNTSLAVADSPSGAAGAHGAHALKVGKNRSDGSTGISTIDSGVLSLARTPGNVVTAQVYVNPAYVAEGNMLMQDLNLRDWSASSSTSGGIYDQRGIGSNNVIVPGNGISPGWNKLRYEVPAGKTDAWPLGRITFNIRTLFSAAAVHNLYPSLSDTEVADLIARLTGDLSLAWYVDSIYVGPAAYEQQAGETPVNFKHDGLNYTEDSPAEEPEDPPGEAADPLMAYVSAAALSNAAADGSSSNPYRTISAAVQATTAGAHIIVGAGTYRETVHPKDSQTLAAAPGENPVISGLDIVSGWTQESGSDLFVADMDWSIDTTYQTTGSKVAGGGNQIFINGEMAYEARWPNAGVTEASGGGLFQFAKAAFDTVTMNFTTKTAVIQDSQLSALEGINLAGATMWYISGQKWNSRPGTVLAHNGQKLTINLNGEAAQAAAQYYQPKPGNEYILYGLKALLDTGDEWYWDSVTRKVYVKGDPSGRVIESKRRETAIDLSDTKAVTVRGISIRGATVMTSSGTEDAVLDGIKAEYINHAANFDNGNVYDAANNGILLAGKRNILMNSEVAYAAGGLVSLQGENNRIINSYLHDADYAGGWASAVTVAGSGHQVSRNTITRAGRDIISMRQAKGAIIEYNDLSYAGELCEDLGTIYTYSADGAGTEIRYNKIHDSEIANGVYLDNNSMNYLVHHNVSYNLKARSGLKNNSISTFNLFFNNTNYNEAPMSMVTITNYPMSAYGTRYYNNITGNNYTVAGDIAWNYNLQLTNAQAESIFRNPGQGDFRLKEGLATWYGAFSGKRLEGINSSGYIGAYEYDAATGAILNDFKTGHDFSAPADTAAPELAATPYRNAVGDGTFDRLLASDNYDIAAPWAKYGTGSVKLKRDSAFYVRNDGFGANLAGAGTGIRQTVEGLKPHTDYVFTARVQSGQQSGVVSTLTGGRARLGVISGTEVTSTEAQSGKLVIRANTSTNMPEWVLVQLPFRTGENTSVEVFAEVLAVAVNVDNIGVLLPLAETDAHSLLAEAIAQADNLLDSAPDMPEAVASAFGLQIGDARALWGDPAASSAQLESGTEQLREASEDFALRKKLLLELQSAEKLYREMIFDGSDYNYPPSAKAALEAVIAGQQAVLEDNGTSMEQVSAAIEAVAAGKLAFYDAIIMPSIEQYAKADMQEMLSSGEHWSRKGLSGDYAVDGDGFMSFRSSTGEGNNAWSKGATFYGSSRFGNAIFEADMDYAPAEGDWPGILVRAQVAQESMWGDNQNEYLTVFRTNNVELQKWINGSEDLSFRVVFPTEAIHAGINRIETGAVDVYRNGAFLGVRIFFYANGQKIYDFLDKSETAIKGDGYFGLALYPPANALKLRAVAESPSAAPSAVLSGPSDLYPGGTLEASLGVGGLAASGGMEALQAVISYDPARLMFDTVTDDNGTPGTEDDLTVLAPGAVAGVRSGFQVIATGAKPSEGKLLLLLMATGGAPAADDGPVALLRGRMAPDAPPGETTLAVTEAVYSLHGRSFPLDVSGAALQLLLGLADKTELNGLLAQARTLLAGASIGSEPGQYPQSAAAALQSAVAAAAVVSADAAAGQEAVASAAAQLEQALEVFRQAAIPLEPADKTALQAAIAAARELAGRAVEGGKLGMYAPGSKQVLLDAIADAETVNLAPAAGQAAVNTAAAALLEAQTLFESGFVSLVAGETRITLTDLSLLSQYYGATPEDAEAWSIVGKADLFDEGEISIRALAAVARMIVLDWLRQ